MKDEEEKKKEHFSCAVNLKNSGHISEIQKHTPNEYP
jgi:hypothetical protein